MTCAYIWLSIYRKRILLFIVIDALDFANCASADHLGLAIPAQIVSAQV
jgi:hypothetical protein